jgi:hypothetical protein
MRVREPYWNGFSLRPTLGSSKEVVRTKSLNTNTFDVRGGAFPATAVQVQ